MGASMIVLGVSPILLGSEGDYFDFFLFIGCPIAAGGIIAGTSMILVANHKIKKYNSLKSLSIYQHEFSLGKTTNITADVNVLSDNFTKQKTLGLGFHLNF